eukprot:scaffold467686_cov45-Prasinocladus_malaysianus.AAC.1
MKSKFTVKHRRHYLGLRVTARDKKGLRTMPASVVIHVRLPKFSYFSDCPTKDSGAGPKLSQMSSHDSRHPVGFCSQRHGLKQIGKTDELRTLIRYICRRLRLCVCQCGCSFQKQDEQDTQAQAAFRIKTFS